MLYIQVDTIKIQMFGTEEFVFPLTDVRADVANLHLP